MGFSLAPGAGSSQWGLGFLLFLGSFAVAGSITGCEGCGEPPPGASFDAAALDTSRCGGALCGAGEICHQEQCTLACSEADDCGVGDSCTNDGYCRLAVPSGEGVLCLTDDQCDSRNCLGGSCVSARDCLNDGECFTDEICSPDGFCVTECQDELDCPGGEVCAKGGCIASTSCSGDEDCPDGGCIDGVCEATCDPDAADDTCGLDVDCSEAGLCVPRCESHADCPDGYCVYGQCLDEIPDDTGDVDVDMGADVGDDMGTDLVDDGDSSDEESDERVPDCYTNEDCDDEVARCEDGVCVLFDICQDDLDCYDGQYCHRGQCRALCASDDDCRGEQSCVDQRCVDQEDDAACRSTEDCEPCESCIYGVCSVSEFFCRSDDDCGFGKTCENGFCAFVCEAGAECPTGQSCVDLVCLDDPPASTECVFNADCDEGFFCINGRCHVDCATHSECGFREMCDHGICQPDRRPGAECLLNAHCADEDPTAECVNGYCALPCFESRDCRSGTCDTGFCTR